MSDAFHSGDSHDRRLDEVLAEYLRAVEAGQTVDRDTLVAQHPELADDLRSFFRNRDAMLRIAEPLRASDGASADEPTIGLTGLPLDGSVYFAPRTLERSGRKCIFADCPICLFPRRSPEWGALLPPQGVDGGEVCAPNGRVERAADADE